MNKRKLHDPILYSNILFFFNAIAYLIKNYYLLFFLMLGCTIFSILYHLEHEENKFYHGMDVVFAYLTLIVTVFYALPYAGLDDLLVLGFILVVALIFRYMANKFDYMIHVYWHIMVFIGQLLIWSLLP